MYIPNNKSKLNPKMFSDVPEEMKDKTLYKALKFNGYTLMLSSTPTNGYIVKHDETGDIYSLERNVVKEWVSEESVRYM